jgi:hypothetical protein
MEKVATAERNKEHETETVAHKVQYINKKEKYRVKYGNKKNNRQGETS